MSGVDRIAVLRATAVGDLVFSLPALHALRATYPQAEITLLGRPWHAAYLRGGRAPLDRVIVVPPSKGVRDEPYGAEDRAELDRFFARMRRERFDIALQLHGGGRWSNPFVAAFGARLTAGARAEDAAPLDRWIPYVYFQSEVARCLETVALVGAQPVTLDPSLAVLPDDRDEAATLVDPGPFAVLHPGASTERRRWPADRFARVGDALVGEGLRVIVTGSGDEGSLVDEVCEAMAAAAVGASDAVTLGGLTGLLSAATIVVSNDTGPLHLASAVGTPTVGIYWIGNLVNGGPLTRANHRPIPSFRINCAVCGRRNVETRCEHDASFVDDVPVEQVIDAARDLLRRAPAGMPM